MIVAWLVVGTAVALCVAGWVPTLRGAVRGVPQDARDSRDTTGTAAGLAGPRAEMSEPARV